LNWHASKGEGF